MTAARRLRILVVDDDEEIRVLLRTTFEVVDIAVDEVGDVAAARAAVATQPPDVVVLDVGLPVVDGLTYARELARERPGLGVVLLTGHSVAAPDAESVAAVVTKPFSPLDLLAAVHRAAGQRYHVLAEAPRATAGDQLLLYADDVRRLLEVERRQRRALEQSYNETLRALAAALEFRDVSTGAHSSRVQRYALELTRLLAPELLEEPSVAFGYLLHDIGKVAIPDGILRKPGPLTFDERVVMEQHTTLGAEILGGVRLLDGHGLAIVRHHHERWDGSGYPDGLAGEEIPLPARLFAVADAVDAITSDRPYRLARPWSHAAAEIERGAGAQFDPEVVDAFGDAIPTLRAVA